MMWDVGFVPEMEQFLQAQFLALPEVTYGLLVGVYFAGRLSEMIFNLSFNFLNL